MTTNLTGIELSEYAMRLGRHIAHVSEKGLMAPIDWSIVAERFTHDDRPHMVEAAFELKAAGLLRVSQAMGAVDSISSIRPEYDLYWVFDQEIFNYDTAGDIVTLIDLILDDENRGNAATLHACLDWSHRRLNPAFARIVGEIPDGRVRNTIQADYVTTGILMTPEDRVALRALRKSLERRAAPKTTTEIHDSETPKTIVVKIPYFEFEIEVPRWAAISLAPFIAVLIVSWNWPTIVDRYPFLTVISETVLMEWSEDAGVSSEASLRIPPVSDRDRKIEIYVRYEGIYERPGDPTYQLTVSVNGNVEQKSEKIGSSPTVANEKEFRFIMELSANATMDIEAKADTYGTKNQSLIIEAKELN